MISFEVNGVEQLNRKFSRFSQYIDDIRGAYPDMKKSFYNNERRQFETEEGKWAWAPLEESYANWKVKNYPGKKILELSGLLKDTMQGNTPYLKWQEGLQQLAVEVNLDYAFYHQVSTKYMPAREVIWLNEATKKAFTHILHRWLWGVAKNVGLGGTIGGLYE